MWLWMCHFNYHIFLVDIIILTSFATGFTQSFIQHIFTVSLFHIGHIMCACIFAKSLQLCPKFCDLWTVAACFLCPVGFSWQEYWGGLLCPPPRDLLTRDQTQVWHFLHWQAGSFPLALLGKPIMCMLLNLQIWKDTFSALRYYSFGWSQTCR